jgi:hypothetical protein
METCFILIPLVATRGGPILSLTAVKATSTCPSHSTLPVTGMHVVDYGRQNTWEVMVHSVAQ